MKEELAFSAPWQPMLKGISLAAALLLAALAVGSVRSGNAWMALLIVSIPLGAVPFAIRGYILSPDEIFVRRPGWNKRIPLDGLQSVEVDPRALRCAIRTCGNGGLFSFTGWFWSKRLRTFRAFATDCNRAVVLRFPRRTIVVTPGDPARFAAEIKRLRNL